MNKTSFNVLIATEQKETAAQELVLNSKYLNELYSTIATEKAIEVKFNTFKELAHKCKTLKIDVVIVENQKWILQGIADVLKKNFVNCIALTSQANKLLLSYSYSRKLLDLEKIIDYTNHKLKEFLTKEKKWLILKRLKMW